MGTWRLRPFVRMCCCAAPLETASPSASAEASANRLHRADVRAPFVLTNPPLVAIRLSALATMPMMADMHATASNGFSRQSSARIAGILYLLIIAAGGFAEIGVRQRLIVPRDAAATAINIANHAFLLRFGIFADLSTFACAIPVAIILYVLLRPFGRISALLMVVFSLIQDAVGALNQLNTYRPLQLLGNAAYLKVFSREQLEAMALLSLNSHSIGFAIALLFFGCSCLALGYLIYESDILPRALGVLITIAGVCYLVNSTAVILSPRWASMLFPLILVPAFIAELSLAVWLTVKGVNVAGWREKAGNSTASS